MILRGMYLILGVMFGIMITTETLGKRFDAVYSWIPSYIGAAAWQGCEIGRKAPKISCESVGLEVYKTAKETQ